MCSSNQFFISDYKDVDKIPFVRTVVRMRVIASYSLLFISILLNIFCPYFSILLDFIFPCATQTLFSFHLPPTHVATRR